MRRTEDVANNIGISGFKYVIGSEVSFYRRFVWLLAILLASAWMMWNIQGRVTYFLSRPSAITTQIKFKDELMFPKITICNQNTFRSSKVFYETVGPRTSASLYEAIDRYLQVLKDGTGYQLSKQEVIEKYGKLLSDENIREFYRRVAHQKDTLINRCRWKGRQCGPENFTEVFTNKGVCYQFTSTTDDMLVDKANADGGLEVMLVVEQYDYMRGAQTSAGALVVIMDQTETEILAKEQGIVVTVGHSASIGLHKSEVFELAHPYGSCGTAELDIYADDTPYTYQKCQLTCLTLFIKRKCGCVSFYMPGNDTAYCTLLEDLQCVRPNEELFYRNNEIKTCDCPTPCHSVTYTTSLSLVQFSESFKQSLALSKGLASITEDHAIPKIEAWGLLNTINSGVTVDLALMGLTFVDYKTKWNRLSSMMHALVEEEEHLMSLVSRHNLTSLVMDELKPGQNTHKTWKWFAYVISRIKMTLAQCDARVSAFDNLNAETIDYTMATADFIEVFKKEIVWLDLLHDVVEQSVTSYMKYLDSVFEFSSIVNTHMKKMNISGVKASIITSNIFALLGNTSTLPRNPSTLLGNGSAHPGNTSTLIGKSSALLGNNSALPWSSRTAIGDFNEILSDMIAFSKMAEEQSSNITNQYKEDMMKLTKIWEKARKKLVPSRSRAESINIDKNLLNLEIYFKDLGVKEWRKSPAYSVEGLVCDIGGSIGLCLGGSILTVVEVLDILAILFANRKTRTTETKEDQAERTDTFT